MNDVVERVVVESAHAARRLSVMRSAMPVPPCKAKIAAAENKMNSIPPIKKKDVNATIHHATAIA